MEEPPPQLYTLDNAKTGMRSLIANCAIKLRLTRPTFFL